MFKIWKKRKKKTALEFSSSSMGLSVDLSEISLEDSLFLTEERVNEVHKMVEEDLMYVDDVSVTAALYAYAHRCKHPNELAYFSLILGMSTKIKYQ